MTYRSIDRRRLTYLLNLGTDAFELRRFFAECRVPLIQRGARVQNLPSGEKARIRAIAYELPGGTDDVLRDWFAQHITMSDPEAPGVIVDTFKLHEEVGEELDEESARRLARSCLVHLFSDDPPADLLEFLRTPIGGDKAEEQVTPHPAEPEVNLVNLPYLMLDLIQGRDVDEHLEGLPPEMGAFAMGLQAAAQGRFDEAQEALQYLPSGTRTRAALDQFIGQQVALGSKEPPKGPTIISLESFTGPFEIESDQILGYCTRADSPNAVFVHPIAVVRGSALFSLSSEQRRSLFPSNGDVMAFPGRKYPRQPNRGEVGIWHVLEHETDKATRYHITGEPRTVYELVSIPFPSRECDSVREYIKEFTQRRLGKFLQPPVFVLSDGLVVSARSEKTDMSKDEAFEAGLLLWNSIPAWRLEGRIFTLGPLPDEQGNYECASISSTVRKLLKPHLAPPGTKQTSGLTKAQLAELAQQLGSGEAEITASRLLRVKAELERLTENREALEALVEQILAHPSVSERIDAFVRQEAASRISEKTEIQSEIGRLQKERAEWEQKIEKQKDEHRKLRNETTKTVRAAFEKAKSQGVATLAELAIFQELIGYGSGNQSLGWERASAATGIYQPAIRTVPKAASDPVAVLREFGVGAQRASAIATAGKVILETGLILAVRGMAVRLAVERWAQSLGIATIIEATVGLLDDAPLKELLNNSPRPQVLAVLDANLSALDIYARPIADEILDRISKGRVGPTGFLLGLSDSVGQLPMPKSFEQLSITVNLETKYDFNSDVQSMMEQLFDVDEGVLQERLWAPAIERLHNGVLMLDSDTQRLVLPVLASAKARS